MSDQKTAVLYLDHFGLREAPFKITPTTEFFYGGGQRGEILHALLYAIEVGEGIMSVTGEVGSGKTMLLRTLIEKLPDHIDIIYIANPSLSGSELLYNICEELGLQASKNRPDTVRMLQSHLIAQHGKDRRVIAFIDEAQAMPDESLEEIRLLSNLETSRDKLLQIVLFGQPEFEEKLKKQNMRQLRERITVALKLKPFGRDDVREYIATRLRAAGYNGAQMFANDACRMIALISQGLSRRINVLADKAMLSAYERSSLIVNYADARRAMRDINFGKMRYRSEQSRHMSKQLTIGIAAAATLLLVIAASVRLYSGGNDIPPTAENDIPVQIEEEIIANTEYKPTDNATALIDSEIIEVEGQEIYISNGEAVYRVNIDEEAQTAAAAVQVIQSVVLQTVTVQAPATARQPTNDRQALLSAISDINRGVVSFNGEQLAAQLGENAEAHGETPQVQGGGNSWQEVAAAPPSFADNKRWSWMPASSYLRNRLNATETWLQTIKNSNSYTARLLTVSQERAVFLEKFLRYFSDFYPIRNVMIYPLQLEGGDKFVVTFGVYNTRNDAEVFLSNIPYYFTGGRPFPQQLSTSVAETQHAWQTQ
ncbi:MAG: AAA family ATPase [Proteobacteria bacterium]|nr:AAA family ATPase [Pseudomonadota bacterium]